MGVFPSEKTVFILDHTLVDSSGVDIDLEGLCKSRLSSSSHAVQVPLRPVTKTLWTCLVEAITEYCRIVFDVFPGSRYIAFLGVGDKAVTKMTSWDHEQQSLNAVMQSLQSLGAAQRGIPDLMEGCREALVALTRPSPSQHQGTTVNKGRVVLVTKLHSEQEARLYYSKFCEVVSSVNMNLGEGCLPLAHVNLVMLNFMPVQQTVRVSNSSLGATSLVSGNVVAMQCGPALAAKLCSLVVRHYNLASTTVIGIPMKEEQNAQSSANYDVELFHPAEAHFALIDENNMLHTRQDTDYPTVTLKWCTPRSGASHELHQCSTAFRITSVDVNSRPSSCLTNFLLNGRWVMLESPKKTSSNSQPRVLSHMLAAHGGDIYIHTLSISRSVLEDPPSISEGRGGKVTDYRINDFIQFMRANSLGPLGSSSDGKAASGGSSSKVSGSSSDVVSSSETKDEKDGPKGGMLKCKERLKRQSKVWPITLGQSTLFALGQVIEPITKAVVEETMTFDQVLECKQVIINLVNEFQGENSFNRTKYSKKEHFNLIWNELEQFLKAHNYSENHHEVLKCFYTCTDREAAVEATPASEAMEVVAVDDALEQLENAERLASPEVKRRRLSSGTEEVRPPIPPGSSLAFIMQSMQPVRSRAEFPGRQRAVNNVSSLYRNLQAKEDQGQGSNNRRK